MTAAALAATVGLARRGFRLAVDLVVGAGETLAVMGPSGAGKSTLLDVLAGLLRPDRGEVRVGDRIVTSGSRVTVPASRRGVVLLGQDPRLFPHLSARDNVAFGLRARGIDRLAARREADEWLWRVGLPGVGEHRPSRLSGGQQQRVALARALATAPQVLLLDEPLTSLDPETAAGIRTVLAEQLPTTTAVVVTHDAVDAMALAARLLIVESGEISQEGPVREVLAAPATSFVAAVAGLDRLDGVVRDGRWEGDGLALPVPDAPDGEAAVVFPPGAVEVHPVAEPTWTAAIRLAPAPGPGEWIARVERLEPTPAGVRVRTAPAGVAVDLSLDRAAELHLAPGTPLRLRLPREAVRTLPVSRRGLSPAAPPRPPSRPHRAGTPARRADGMP